MPWFWARVHDRTQQLGYLRGGFQQLYDRLAEGVREAGGETRFGTSVTSVKTDGDELSVETDGGTERFDRVVSTLATRLTARLVPELPAGVARSARMGSSLRRALHDPGAGSAADIGLLAEHERPGLSRSWPSSSTRTTGRRPSTAGATSSTSATTGRWTTR